MWLFQLTDRDCETNGTLCNGNINKTLDVYNTTTITVLHDMYDSEQFRLLRLYVVIASIIVFLISLWAFCMAQRVDSDYNICSCFVTVFVCLFIVLNTILFMITYTETDPDFNWLCSHAIIICLQFSCLVCWFVSHIVGIKNGSVGSILIHSSNETVVNPDEHDDAV
jgi:heme/copper-type cytochrome/quinol oxidase subunit 4